MKRTEASHRCARCHRERIVSRERFEQQHCVSIPPECRFVGDCFDQIVKAFALDPSRDVTLSHASLLKPKGALLA